MKGFAHDVERTWVCNTHMLTLRKIHYAVESTSYDPATAGSRFYEESSSAVDSSSDRNDRQPRTTAKGEGKFLGEKRKHTVIHCMTVE